MPDTIAALATGGGLSAIGIIRLSGDDAIDIASQVFHAKSGMPLSQAQNRKLYYGEFLNDEGNVIDLCLCTVSRAPDSYTGENTVEFQCHGSPVVLNAGLKTLFHSGARQATAGEFTKRAFLNGRMDLTQAEAVVDLIDAQTLAAAQNAAGQLGRAIGRKTDIIYDELINIMSHFHAVIDYPDEDIDDFELKNYTDTLTRAENVLSTLLSTFEQGQILKEGIKSAIIGRPNTGKSSLLNALLGYNRAIVTAIAGTTRDVIEEKVKMGAVVLRLSDTAGIRQTEDIVEGLGVERALAATEQSQLVLAVFDGSEKLTDEDRQVINAIKDAENVIAVINKSDIEMRIEGEEIRKLVDNVCIVSTADGTGLDQLREMIEKMFLGAERVPSGEILTNGRQADAVERALDSIKTAKSAMFDGVTPDAVLTELEAALSALGEITGKTVREDITARIFERFCVGK